MFKTLLFLVTFSFLSTSTIAQIGEKKVFDIDFSDFNINKKDNKEPEKEVDLNNKTKIANLLDFNRRQPSLSNQQNAGFVLKSNIDLNSLGKLKPRNRDTFGKKSDMVSYRVKKLPKQLKNIEGGSKIIFTDQNLGEIITKSEYLDFYYRDFGTVDGDIIQIFVDEGAFIPMTTLTGKYKTVRLKLKNGFAKLDLYSVYDGRLSPTTVDWVVKDDQGKVVAKNVLGVSKGFKGTIVVIKN